MATDRFDFAFDRRAAPVLALFGVRPSTSHVLVDDERFEARAGRWGVSTPLTNIKDVTVAGGYRWYRVLGLRVSLADRGATFGTTARAGVCVSFREPVPALLGRRLRHPNLTVTVRDPEGLVAALRARIEPR